MEEFKKKILLIEPPFYRLFKNTYSLDRYPLSLAYLAGAIKKQSDWNVLVYNADFYPKSEYQKIRYLSSVGFDNYLSSLKDLSHGIWQEIKTTIHQYSPSVIGISAKSQNFASACLVAKIAKGIDKNIIVVVGGPHPSLVGKEVLNCDDFDIGVKGEGENTIVDLLRAIESGKKLNDIQGISYRENNRVIVNRPRELIEDLDYLSFPHENISGILKDHEQYPSWAFGNIFAIRGCPYNCNFCGSHKIWSHEVRYRSAENIIKEIKGLQKKGLKFIHFEDDTFGINKEYINNLCYALKINCPGIKWSCELHVNLVDNQTVSLMKSAGCFLIEVGIESGNNEILKAIRKNITIEKAYSACEIIRRQGIKIQAFFMVGFPQETEKSLKDTIKAMKKINCDILIYSIFTPYKGTDAFEICKEKGIIDDINYDISLYNHQSPANCFTNNIDLLRFRELVSKIEKMVDNKNLQNRLKRIFSFDTVGKIQQLGIYNSIKKCINIFVGK